MSTILIAGGSGLIGTELRHFLLKSGYSVNVLTRKPTNKSKNLFNWDIAKQSIDIEAFDNVIGVINLAGSSIIGGRWTTKKKKELIDSRVLSTQLLVHTINTQNVQVTHFIQASAMGFYGNSGTTILTEDSSAGQDFMAQLCVAWEAEANKLSRITPSILRIGLYLHKQGGVYKTIAQLAKFFLATAFGNGKQYVNYTHKDEFNTLVLSLLQDTLSAGVYNAVGKHPLTLGELTRAIAKNEKRSVILPNVPAFLLKLGLGEASATLLNSYRVTSTRLKNTDIQKFNSISEALAAL